MKPIWTIVITVIVTAGIVGGGGYYYLDQRAVDEKAELQIQIDDLEDQISTLQKASVASTDDSTSSSSSTTTNETADWKTYTSDDYKFSFKYPSEYSISKDSLPPVGQLENSPSKYVVSLKDGDRTLDLWVNPGGFGMPCGSDMYKATIQDGGIVVSEKTSYLDETSDACPEIHGQVWLGAKLVHNDNSIFINFGFDLDDRTYELTQTDKIIATFKFTN